MAEAFAEFLRPPGYSGPRGLRPLAAEARVVREAAHLLRRAAGSPVRPDGQDQPVMFIPGFMAGDATLTPMRNRLRRYGYRTYRSRIHTNVRCVQQAGERLEERLETIATRNDRPVAIVGHSLGGLMAKALARRRPDLIAGIVALGSPLRAPGAVHRALAVDVALLHRLNRFGFGGVMSVDCSTGDCARRSWEELIEQLQDSVTFTSVYSKRDGIIDWRACLDPGAEHVEVDCSHVGMAVDATVFQAVVAALGALARPSQPDAAESAGVVEVDR